MFLIQIEKYCIIGPLNTYLHNLEEQNMQNQCSRCLKPKQLCVPCIKKPCKEKLCFACLNEVYQQQYGQQRYEVKFPCGHERESKEVREIVRSRCCKCCKKLGQNFYELADGRIIDALCMEGYKDIRIRINDISCCQICKSMIGLSVHRQTKLPGQQYTYKNPICIDCQKRSVKKESWRQNNFLKSKPQLNTVLVQEYHSKSPSKRQNTKIVRMDYDAYTERVCVNCRCAKPFCSQICQGTFLCTFCKWNESRYYGKKEEDENFKPELYGKLNRTLFLCFKCNKRFFFEQMIKNIQTNRLCCADCDWQIKQAEKKKMERERVQDSFLDEEPKIVTIKSQTSPVPKQYIIEQEEKLGKSDQKASIYTTKENASELFKQKQPENNSLKIDQPRTELKNGKFIKFMKKKIPQPEELKEEQDNERRKLNIQVKPINQCKMCGIFFEKDHLSLSKNIPDINNQCMLCTVQKLNKIKERKSVEKRAQSAGKLGNNFNNQLGRKPLLTNTNFNAQSLRNGEIAEKNSLKKKKLNLVGSIAKNIK